MSVARNTLIYMGVTVSTFLVLPGAHAQPVTIAGSLKDQYSRAAVGGATIEIVNPTNPGERYTTTTDTLGEWTYTIEPSGVGEPGEVPASFSLFQNYPNPFNGNLAVHEGVFRSQSRERIRGVVLHRTRRGVPDDPAEKSAGGAIEEGVVP